MVHNEAENRQQSPEVQRRIAGGGLQRNRQLGLNVNEEQKESNNQLLRISHGSGFHDEAIQGTNPLRGENVDNDNEEIRGGNYAINDLDDNFDHISLPLNFYEQEQANDNGHLSDQNRN